MLLVYNYMATKASSVADAFFMPFTISIDGIQIQIEFKEYNVQFVDTAGLEKSNRILTY